ncbi:hypothetical protein BC833DRAFT_427021 [Globomyces pollinis-pini]|nr:hypothetical protein BC833DRAFT_427021 [Globomyces pollinis-pini]
MNHYLTLTVGSTVETVGLATTAMNGKTGRIHSILPRNRVAVIFDGERSPKSLKKIQPPPNLAARQWECQRPRENQMVFLLLDETPKVMDARGREVGSNLLKVNPGSQLTLVYPSENNLENATFTWHDPASLAMELFVLTSGGKEGNDWKHLEGGLTYMVGVPDIFLSMALLWKTYGTILPPLLPSYASYKYDEGTVAAMEIDSKVAAGNRRMDLESIAAYCLLDSLADDALRDWPWMDYKYDVLPTSVNQLPPWWKCLAELWDSAFKDYFESGIPPCMFYGIPGGYGCKKGDSCKFRHSDRWVKVFTKIEEFKLMKCENCNSYAEDKCQHCLARYFCSDGCKKASEHELNCVQDSQKRIALNEAIRLASIRNDRSWSRPNLSMKKYWSDSLAFYQERKFQQAIRLLTKIIDSITVSGQSEDLEVSSLQVILKRAECYFCRAQETNDEEDARTVFEEYSLAQNLNLFSNAAPNLVVGFKEVCKSAACLLAKPALERLERNIKRAEALSEEAANSIIEECDTFEAMFSQYLPSSDTTQFRNYRERALKAKITISFIPPTIVSKKKRKDNNQKRKPQEQPKYSLKQCITITEEVCINRNSCPGCMNEWKDFDDSSYAFILPCGHAICAMDLTRWLNPDLQGEDLRTNPTCFLCRKAIDKLKIEKLLHSHVADDRVPGLVEFGSVLQLNNYQIKTYAANLIMANNFDMVKVFDALFNMAMFKVREENVTLTLEENQEIFNSARKQVWLLQDKEKSLREELDESIDRSDDAKSKYVRTRLNTVIKELESAREQARLTIHQKIHSVGSMGVESFDGTILFDFHCLTPIDAKKNFREFIAPILPAVKKVVIITGKGLHSESGTSILRQHLKNYILSLGISCNISPKNAGRLIVSVS